KGPRAWHTEINGFLQSIGFQNSSADTNLFIAPDLFLLLFVDDALIFAKGLNPLSRLKQQLTQKYEMTDLGEAKCFLGLEIRRNRATRMLHISQTSYVNKILSRFGMADCNGITIPMEASSNLRAAANGSPSYGDQRYYQSTTGS